MTNVGIKGDVEYHPDAYHRYYEVKGQRFKMMINTNICKDARIQWDHPPHEEMSDGGPVERNRRQNNSL